MYVCMHTYIRIYVCIYVYTYIHTCIYVHACIHTHIHMSDGRREASSHPLTQLASKLSSMALTKLIYVAAGHRRAPVNAAQWAQKCSRRLLLGESLVCRVCSCVCVCVCVCVFMQGNNDELVSAEREHWCWHA
jgi:hypothetical protein